MSAQSLIGYGILIVFGALIWGVAGYIVGNVIVPWGNGFIAFGVASQDSYNTALTLIQIMVASPFLMILLWGYDHINNSNMESGGQ